MDPGSHGERPRRGLARPMRLARQRDFDRVFQGGCSVADGRLVVYAAANELGAVRLGLAVSARLGGAVKRNRIRRRLREAFRHEQHRLPGGFDYVLIPRNTPAAASVDEYRRSVGPLADQAAAKWRRAARPTGRGPGPS